MPGSSPAPLRGARIWLPGTVPDAADGLVPSSIRSFVEQLSEKIFRDGGSIIHGSHPTIWPSLLKQATKFQQAGGARDCLTLAVSRQFSSAPEQSGIDMNAWRACSLVHEVPAEPGNNAQHLKRLRNWLAERFD